MMRGLAQLAALALRLALAAADARLAAPAATGMTVVVAERTISLR